MTDMSKKLEMEFDEWFNELKELSAGIVHPTGWVVRWFDGYTPSEALEEGPESEW